MLPFNNTILSTTTTLLEATLLPWFQAGSGIKCVKAKQHTLLISCLLLMASSRDEALTLNSAWTRADQSVCFLTLTRGAP